MYNYSVMIMNLKSKIIISFIIVIMLLLLIIGGKFVYDSLFGLAKEPDVIEEPQDRKLDFDIINSNYIDKYYDRYVAYRKLHSEYTDDQVITYVNIGLDHEFYTDVMDTDMSDGYLILCNKYHKLDKDYVPDLVSLDGYGGGQMERVAASAFKEMSEAAKKDGIKIYNVSGYRDYKLQAGLYEKYVNNDGKEKADTYSARPGTSEHQTGLATDINYVSSKFENTDAFKWLVKNSYKYGFILRYPKGKEYITGYKYEPWHYRYVGVDVARIIYEEDITFDEYYATYILKG